MQRVTESLRNRKSAAKVIKELDAFPKVPQDYQETSASGGTVSVVVFLFIGILMLSEFSYYRGTEMKYTYEVDRDAERKITINVDITVAMKCDDIGADVLDLSGTSIDTDAHLRLEETYFRLGQNQRKWRDLIYRHQTDGYRTINDVFEMYGVAGGKSLPTFMPPRDDNEFKDEPLDACRIFGGIDVNKVAGNFHITAGKSIPHPRGHAHLSALVSEDTQNFSHRIDKLSFGTPIPGVINPLDGDIQVTGSHHAMYQYYIKIVPTYIKSSQKKFATNQFSVTQRARVVDPLTGGRGVPGIYFKYDLSSIMVSVAEEGRPFWQFLVRLCGIIGGIFATSGMLHSFVGFLFEMNGKQILSRSNSQISPSHESQSVENQKVAPQVNPVATTSLPNVAANGGMEEIRLVEPQDILENEQA